MIRFLLIILIAMISFLVHAKSSDTEEGISSSSANSFGTGWFVSPGYVVTNNHVVAEHEKAVIILSDKTEISTAVHARDVVNDIALLKIVDDTKIPTALPLAIATPSLGEQVFTIGFPHPNLMGSNPKLSEGIISSITGLANDPRFFQISAPVQAGNSGGPLLNMKGEVVGIVTSKLNAIKMFKWTGDIPQNVNYAVKTKYLRSLIESTDRVKKEIKTFSRKRTDLVSLAGKIQGSIVRIKSGESSVEVGKNPGIAIPGLGSNEQIKPKRAKVHKVALFTHMTRGYYSNTGDLDSTEVYSNNTAKLIKDYIERNKDKRFKVTHSIYGGNAARMYYTVYSKEAAIKLCRSLDVDYLMAVKNDYPVISYYYEEFDLVIKDCAKNSEFARMYDIEIKTHDKFNYEIDIRDSLRKFMVLFNDQI